MPFPTKEVFRKHYFHHQLFYCKSFYPPLLCLFLLFLFLNGLLVYYLYDRHEPSCLKQGTCRLNKKPRTLPREKWGQTLYLKVLLENFRRIKDEWRLVRHLNSTVVDVPAEFNCSSLQRIENLKFIATGWTKSAYKVILNNRTISMKIINVDGHDISTCITQEDRYLYDCYLIAASKVLREISVLSTISHPNVVKILGYCIPADPDIENPLRTIAIFEEFGEPINVIKMLQLSWEDRLRISLGLSRLLKHLASFEEPIALNDFRRQQFVVIDGELKLIDVDDVGLREPKCNEKPCCFNVSEESNKTICVPCVNNVCHSFNEKMNILKTGGHFIRHILPHGAPSGLNNQALRITSAFELASLNSADIHTEMENLVNAFKNGQYGNGFSRFLSGFRMHKQKDLSSDFDYRCQLTAFGYGCMMSVHDAEEAAEICHTDVECKAFVITNITTWTGRKIALFKNGIGAFIDNNTTTLYVKHKYTFSPNSF